MTDYRSTSTAAALAARLRAARSAVLVTHAKPDGDAVGSLVALHRALEQVGVRATSIVMGPVEPSLVLAAGATPLRRLERDGAPTEEPDVVAVLDTGSWSQLEPIAAWLRPRLSKTIGVDHHRRGDDVAAAGRIVEPGWASTTQALVPVIEGLGASIDAPSSRPGAASTEPIATPLYMGLATDTGWFRFSNADAAVFALAARLVAAGARKEWLYATLEQNARPARLALTARALASMRLMRGDRVAIMTLSRDDFVRCAGGPEDIGGLVNEPMVLASVRVAVLVSQHESGSSRASFRSKPAGDGAADGAGASVDVNAIAASLGGGGHVQAAGAKLAMDLPEAVMAVERALAGA